jgi:hypothetical protein
VGGAERLGALASGGAAVTSVEKSIALADSLLPGVPAPEGEIDERWQAIIGIGEFIATDPEPIWEFIVRWGVNDSDDVRAAIATVLLEHMLEHHFDTFFTRIESLAVDDANFADTLSMCWAFGESKSPQNLGRLKALLESVDRIKKT